MSRDCVIPGTPDVAFINLSYSSGIDRPGRARLARAEQAAAHRGRRLRADGRLRRHERRAGAGLRLGREVARPGVVRRIPAQLPHRRHRLAACGARLSRLLRQMEDFCAAIAEGALSALIGNDRSRGRNDNRGCRPFARRGWTLGRNRREPCFGDMIVDQVGDAPVGSIPMSTRLARRRCLWVSGGAADSRESSELALHVLAQSPAGIRASLPARWAQDPVVGKLIQAYRLDGVVDFRTDVENVVQPSGGLRVDVHPRLQPS